MFGSKERTLVGWAIIIGMFTILVCAVGWLATESGRLKREAQGANANAAFSTAGAESAKDAINETQNQVAREQLVDEKTKENGDEISAQKDSDTNVGGGTTSVARRKLCERAAYRNDPSCK